MEVGQKMRREKEKKEGEMAQLAAQIVALGRAKGGDTDGVVEILSRISEMTSSFDAETLAQFSIDLELKQVLRENRKAEVIEKTAELLPLIRNPKNLYDELVGCLGDEELGIPTLMTVYLLQQETEFHFSGFEAAVLDAIRPENARVEGFLFFILQIAERSIINRGCRTFMVQVADRLILAATDGVGESKAATRILYAVLVLLRMHPAIFQEVQLRRLNILRASVGNVRQMAERILLEARNAFLRPKRVFLDNFSFPEDDLLENRDKTN
ncbi:hypothetical protein ECANGB1_1321 [Enterospora canceri]|uniref:Uncharacterized protein n=1 Tax=Enterospora canceri TaxID=1081671 RepID=A0A1Y1S6D3_9MICR|nr:hypothetical protein ECANGB1_1321 [Enterospora canceri]